MAKFKFELLAGNHNHNIGTDEQPNIVKHRQGDIFETNLELDKMFNSPGSIKFLRLEHQEEDTEEYLSKLEADLKARRERLKAKANEKPAVVDDDELGKKSLQELQEIARSNGIELGKAKSRDEVLKAIRSALVVA